MPVSARGSVRRRIRLTEVVERVQDHVKSLEVIDAELGIL